MGNLFSAECLYLDWTCDPNCELCPNLGLSVGWSIWHCTTKPGSTHQALGSGRFLDWSQLTILVLVTLFGLCSLKIWPELDTRGRICIWPLMIGGSHFRIQRYNSSSVSLIPIATFYWHRFHNIAFEDHMTKHEILEQIIFTHTYIIWTCKVSEKILPKPPKRIFWPLCRQ